MAEKVSSEEKEEILDRVEKRAAAYEYEFHGCGQTILLALQQEFNLPGGTAVLKATGFMGGGTALMGDTCGALVGCMLALGLVSGRERIEEEMYLTEIDERGRSHLPALALTRRFYRRFQKEFGGQLCRDIQTRLFGRSFNMADQKEFEEFQKAGGFVERSKLVGKAARLAAGIILEMPRR